MTAPRRVGYSHASARRQNLRNRPPQLHHACSETTSLRLEVVGSIDIDPLMARSTDCLAITLPPAESKHYQVSTKRYCSPFKDHPQSTIGKTRVASETSQPTRSATYDVPLVPRRPFAWRCLTTSTTSSVFELALYAPPMRPEKVSSVPERFPVTQAASLTAARNKIVERPLSHQYPQVDVPQPLPEQYHHRKLL